jgi:hypothetical protein
MRASFDFAQNMPSYNKQHQSLSIHKKLRVSKSGSFNNGSRPGNISITGTHSFCSAVKISIWNYDKTVVF